MTHRFDILIDGVVHTYTNYEDIPAKIDDIIAFLPDIPDSIGPHTDAEHEKIDDWVHKFIDLMSREKASQNTTDVILCQQ